MEEWLWKIYLVSLKNMFSVLIYMFVYTYMHMQKNDKRQNFFESHHPSWVCLFVDGMTAQPFMPWSISKESETKSKTLNKIKKSWCQYQVLLYVDSQTISCFISLFRRAIISRWDKNLGWRWQEENQVSRNSHLGKIFHNEYLRNN